MEIDFSNAGEKAECKVTISVPACGNVTWTFEHTHTDKFYSGFAVSAMQTQMRDELARIRKTAYEEGWKDARAKKGGKRDWFRRFWGE